MSAGLICTCTHPLPLPFLPHILPIPLPLPVPAAAQEGYPASAFFRCDDDHLALHNGRPCRVVGPGGS